MKTARTILGGILVLLLAAIVFWKHGTTETASEVLSTNTISRAGTVRAQETNPARSVAAAEKRPQEQPQPGKVSQLRVRTPRPLSSVNVLARRMGDPNRRPTEFTLSFDEQGAAALPSGRYVFYVQDRETGLIETMDNGGNGWAVGEEETSVLDLSALRFNEAFIAGMTRLQECLRGNLRL